MDSDATLIQTRGLASFKTGFIHHCLHRKMPVQSQKCVSFYPFVRCVWTFAIAFY